MTDWLNRFFSSRKLTLDDLVLKPDQISVLKNTSTAYRQALYDAGEHCILTSVNEHTRSAVKEYRKYLMGLTLHPSRSNEIQSDRSPIDDINDRRKKLFSPRT